MPSKFATDSYYNPQKKLLFEAPEQNGNSRSDAMRRDPTVNFLSFSSAVSSGKQDNKKHPPPILCSL